nr:MAG TPA: tail collar fiber protein [Caudoviricetes sp.]
MATWDNVVYTTLGLNLMAKLQTGATLEITRAIGSDGHVSADALPALTEITAKQTLTLSDAIYKGNGQALLPVTLYNRGLTEGYPLRQIGIYATDPDDGEVLMLVAQSETPDTIPTELASPDFVVNFSFHIALGNAGRINVTYSLTDMATKADYVAFVEQVEGKLGQPSGIATLDSSGKLAQMPTAADVGAPDIESGSWTPIMMGSDNTGWYETASSIGRYTRIGNVIVVSLVINVKKVPEAAKEKFVLLGGFPKPFDQRCGMGASFAIPYSTGITRLNSSTGQLFGTVYLNDALILRYPNATSFVNMQGSAVSNNAIIAGQFTYLCK